MNAKLPVGILGATGMVGQMYLSLLANHPWFEVTYVAASPRSAGKRYRDAVAGRWVAEPCGDAARRGAGDLIVEDANDVSRAAAASKAGGCAFVFSALAMK
jgi:aspartate-semialdehyde dehydrogenase